MHWWGHIHIEWYERIKWGSWARFVLKTYCKTPSYLTWWAEVIWFMNDPFLNYPRWHDRHSTEVWFRISLMLASYPWIPCPTWFVLPLLGTRKGQVWGSCWQLLSTTFRPSIPTQNKRKVIINSRIRVYTDNFHKYWCLYLLLQDTSKCTWNGAIESK
jgi:hypothetical protein